MFLESACNACVCAVDHNVLQKLESAHFEIIMLTNSVKDFSAISKKPQDAEKTDNSNFTNLHN